MSLTSTEELLNHPKKELFVHSKMPAIASRTLSLTASISGSSRPDVERTSSTFQGSECACCSLNKLIFSPKRARLKALAVATCRSCRVVGKNEGDRFRENERNTKRDTDQILFPGEVERPTRGVILGAIGSHIGDRSSREHRH